MAAGLKGRMMSLARMDSTSIGEVDDAQCRRGWTWFDANFRLMDRGQCAFGSDDQFGEIEFSVPYELVEVVAADPAHDLRKSAIDFVAVGPHDIGDASFQPAS